MFRRRRERRVVVGILILVDIRIGFGVEWWREGRIEGFHVHFGLEVREIRIHIDAVVF